jgi:hypothetical protein
MASAVVTVVVVSFHMRRSELIQNDHYDLGELWRTKSDNENILGSLAMTRLVDEPDVHHDHISGSAMPRVTAFESSFSEESVGYEMVCCRAINL